MPSKIHEKMISVLKDVGAVGKEKFNSFHKFKFRGIDQIINRLHPILAGHGIFILPEVLDSQRHRRPARDGCLVTHQILTVRFSFMADDGSSVSVTVMGESVDGGDKAVAKAMAAALKTALLQTFLIPTENGDQKQVKHDSEPRRASVVPSRAGAGKDQILRLKHMLDRWSKLGLEREELEQALMRPVEQFDNDDFTLLFKAYQKVRSQGVSPRAALGLDSCRETPMTQ